MATTEVEEREVVVEVKPHEIVRREKIRVRRHTVVERSSKKKSRSSRAPRNRKVDSRRSKRIKNNIAISDKASLSKSYKPPQSKRTKSHRHRRRISHDTENDKMKDKKNGKRNKHKSKKEKTVKEKIVEKDPLQAQVIYLVRHGLREDAINKNWKETAKDPHDPPLAKDGLIQCRQLASALESQLQSNAEEILCILSSPFTRTCQTAQVLSERLNVPICLEKGLTEWTPSITPRGKSREDLHEAFSNISPDEEQYNTLVTPNYDEECMDNFFQRCGSVANKLSKHDFSDLIVARGVPRRPQRSVSFSADLPPVAKTPALVLVTHAAVVIGLSRAFTKGQGSAFPGTCSCTKLIRETATKMDGWRITIDADTSFLTIKDSSAKLADIRPLRRGQIKLWEMQQKAKEKKYNEKKLKNQG
eukprot:TRINITY_DN4429_c0_g1_i1.p1 TRINITY_DN4429_c0_g1~~TRINITY_DN4429_c0_g1_i1.p1  ORF type:complete len:417 (-),score=75.61 TRINITY_DN4429_c0_g1_i1:89-1339(-)